MTGQTPTVQAYKHPAAYWSTLMHNRWVKSTQGVKPFAWPCHLDWEKPVGHCRG